MAKLMRCIKEPSANQHLPEPFKIGEKIIYLGEIDKKKNQAETFRKQFIKIRRLKSKRLETVAVKNFEFIKKK